MTDGPRMREIAEALGFEPDNHHNALMCPYCGDLRGKLERELRAQLYAAKHAELLREIAEYENTHPDDAPCLGGASLVIDGKQVTLRVIESSG